MIAGNWITVKVQYLGTYHSNETRGSRGVGRSWREFCSLVRRDWEVGSGWWVGNRETKERPTLSRVKNERVGHPDKKRQSRNRFGEFRMSHPPDSQTELCGPPALLPPSTYSIFDNSFFRSSRSLSSSTRTLSSDGVSNMLILTPSRIN